MNLGTKYEGSLPCCEKQEELEGMHYPSLYVSDLKEPLGVGKEGTAKVSFKILSATKTTRNGKTKYSYEIEVREFSPSGSSKKSEADVLDEIRDEVVSKSMEEEEEDDD